MPEDAAEIVLVDDDPSLLRALSRQVELMGHKATSFQDALKGTHYIASGRGDCLLLDLRMPDVSGLGVQKMLSGLPVPIVFISGHATVPTAVQAIQNGAVTLLEKPVEYEDLKQAIKTALKQGIDLRTRHEQQSMAMKLYSTLTDRQKDVFKVMITGAPNKVIAYQLGIGERTVKAHRQAVMNRLEATSMADIYRLAAALNFKTS